MMWFRSDPKTDGWYFWKENEHVGPFNYEPYFFETAKRYSSPKTFWREGTAVNCPTGGFWFGPIDVIGMES